MPQRAKESLVYATLRSEGRPEYLPWLYEMKGYGVSPLTKDILSKLESASGLDNDALSPQGVEGGAYVIRAQRDICPKIKKAGIERFPINLARYRETKLLLLEAAPAHASDSGAYAEIQKELLQIAKRVDSVEIDCLTIKTGEATSEQSRPEAINPGTLNALAIAGISMILAISVTFDLAKRLPKRSR